MERFKGNVAQDSQAAVLQEEALAAPHLMRISKLEEGEGKGDGWVAFKSLLLLVGGMIVVSCGLFLL